MGAIGVDGSPRLYHAAPMSILETSSSIAFDRPREETTPSGKDEDFRTPIGCDDDALSANEETPGRFVPRPSGTGAENSEFRKMPPSQH